MAGIGIGYGYGIGSGKHYDPVAKAYFAAVPNAFSTARKTIINTLIAGLRSDGNLTKLDRLWLFANTTTGNAVIDVIGRNSATLVNAPAFVADQGYTSDGSTSYVNSNYNIQTSSSNYLRNDASFGVYTRTNIDDAEFTGGAYNIGDASDGVYIQPMRSGKVLAGINGPYDWTVAVSDSLGMTSVSRDNSADFDIFKNGSNIRTFTSASTALPSQSIYFCCGNVIGVASQFTTRQISIGFIGSGSIDQSTLYTRIQTYMTALGTQV